MFAGSRRKTRRLERKVDRLEGKGDVGGLTEMLGHVNILVYSRARKALRRIADDTGIEPLLRALDRSVGIARAEIIRMLGEIGDPTAVPVLVPLLADTSRPRDRKGNGRLGLAGDTVSSVTADALERIGDSSAGDALISVLADENFPTLREPLLSALVTVGGPAVARALLTLLRDENAAPAGLGRLSGPAARAVLVDTLDGRNYARARYPVLRALVEAGASETVEALAELARRGGEKERRAALTALDLGYFQEMRNAEADEAMRDELDPDGALRAALEADKRADRTASGAHREVDDAVSNIRLILDDPGYAVIPDGAVFQSRETLTAFRALEHIVAQRADDVPRWVLYAGATLDDFVAWIEIDGDPAGLRINAADLRRCCRSALLPKAGEQ